MAGYEISPCRKRGLKPNVNHLTKRFKKGDKMKFKLIYQGTTGKHSHEYASLKTMKNAIVRYNNRDGQLFMGLIKDGDCYTVTIGYPIVTIRGVRHFLHAEDGAVVKTRL